MVAGKLSYSVPLLYKFFLTVGIFYIKIGLACKIIQYNVHRLNFPPFLAVNMIYPGNLAMAWEMAKKRKPVSCNGFAFVHAVGRVLKG